MSDNNKNLGDELDDMLDDAREGAKKAADKTEAFANDFANDTKQAFNEVSADGKNIAIIAHLTLIGWIIALIMNSNNKTEIGSFYIRQVIGLLLLSLVAIIPVIGWIVWIIVLVAWVMSLINALNGKMQPTFLLGKQFQDWFKSL